MPRLLRIEYPGAIYHVVSREDQREAFFLDEVDRHGFLKTLAEARDQTGLPVHAYCLRKNRCPRRANETKWTMDKAMV